MRARRVMKYRVAVTWQKWQSEGRRKGREQEIDRVSAQWRHLEGQGIALRQWREETRIEIARDRIVNRMLDRVNARDRLAKAAGELEIGRRLELITEGLAVEAREERTHRREEGSTGIEWAR